MPQSEPRFLPGLCTAGSPVQREDSEPKVAAGRWPMGSDLQPLFDAIVRLAAFLHRKAEPVTDPGAPWWVGLSRDRRPLFVALTRLFDEVERLVVCEYHAEILVSEVEEIVRRARAVRDQATPSEHSLAVDIEREACKVAGMFRPAG